MIGADAFELPFDASQRPILLTRLATTRLAQITKSERFSLLLIVS